MDKIKVIFISGIMILVLGSTLAFTGFKIAQNNEDFEKKILWIENSGLNKFSASYRIFTGDEVRKFTAKENQKITLDYEAEVNKGTLIIEFKDFDGEKLWKLELNQDDKINEEKVWDAEKAGEYILNIKGEETGGSFNIKWLVN